MIATNGAIAAPGSKLKLSGLTKVYRSGVVALADVDLTAAPGEVLAVAGESGCGKTTLLRLVAGLEVPDSGEIRLDGRVVAGAGTWVPPESRGVGMVFQDFALFPHLRVVDNVAFGLAHLPRKERRPRAEAFLEMVGLAGYGERFAHQLSGGQRQRVALARALAPGPRILLLDEPFSNLDAPLKSVLRDELGDVLRAAGTTAILVVHDADDVLVLADRVAVMRAGKVTQVGQPDEVYRHPANEYVARLFGEANVLAGDPMGDGFETPLGFVPCAAAATCRQSVRLCFRPEDLQICADGKGCLAVVDQVRPRGLQNRVQVRFESADGSLGRLTLYTGTEQRLARGDQVFVRPRPGCVHVLRDNDATARTAPGRK